MKKKGQMLGNIQGMIAPLVGIAIVLVIGFLIMSEVEDQTEAIEGVNGYGLNATQTVMAAMDDIPGWLPIVVVAVIGALLLGLVSYFRSR